MSDWSVRDRRSAAGVVKVKWQKPLDFGGYDTLSHYTLFWWHRETGATGSVEIADTQFTHVIQSGDSKAEAISWTSGFVTGTYRCGGRV